MTFDRIVLLQQLGKSKNILFWSLSAKLDGKGYITNKAFFFSICDVGLMIDRDAGEKRV